MAFSVQMPALGESVTEGTVTRWLKQEGDTVEVDEPLLEVSTDKVDTEIPSPAAGVLTKIVAQEDDTVEVGGELAVIGDAGRVAVGAARGRRRTNPPSPSRHRSRSRTAEPEPSRSRQAEPEPGAPAASEQGGGGDRGGDARTRRVRHRRHGHPLAEEGRRRGRGGRAARRGLHRQGRHRDSVAGGGHAGVHHRRGGRHGRGRRRVGPDRQRRHQRGASTRGSFTAPAARRTRTGPVGARSKPAPEPAAPAPSAPAPEAEAGTRAGSTTAHRGRAVGRRHAVRHSSGAKTGRREQHRSGLAEGHRSRRPHPQAGRAGRR